MLTNNEFAIGLLGEPMRTSDGSTRVRYLVAAAISVRAKERHQEGRPDKAGVLRWIASQLETGRAPSKKALQKVTKDIDVVRSRLCLRESA